MINAGAILVCSLLKTLVKPEMTLAEKFDYTQQWLMVYRHSHFRIHMMHILIFLFFYSIYRDYRVERILVLIMLCFCQNVKQLIEIMHLGSICENTNVIRKRQT